MGNVATTLESKDNLIYYVNTIAGRYILQQNFQDLINIKNPDHCNKLVILTSKIIKKNLNNQSIMYLSQHMHGDKIIDKKDTEDIIFLNTASIKDLDIKDKTTKTKTHPKLITRW
mgnify:CR=1 FL=1